MILKVTFYIKGVGVRALSAQDPHHSMRPSPDGCLGLIHKSFPNGQFFF